MNATISTIDHMRAKRAAEEHVRNICRPIGLRTYTALDQIIAGPFSPSVPVLIVTDGSTWTKGAYLAIASSANDEIYFLLDDGESFAHINAISEHRHLRQWKFPDPGNDHLPGFTQTAENAANRILNRLV